ncbi:MAG TPA: TetR/AcrR family transcriptional regulator [Caulobacterales bacterium]|nr:TetR/AcrR family transcriptional regulator [Caulobacterales bacterium]
MARLADPLLAERRRRQILEAAIGCFRRRGFHQATMQEICAEAGISPGALYRYFDSKADIIAAIGEDECTGFNELLRRAQSKGDLMHALCALARSFFEHAATDGALVADLFAEAARDPLLSRSLGRSDAISISQCAEAIRAAQARGDADPSLDPTEAAQTLFASMCGIGLRSAMLQRVDVDHATTQFQELAKRYLRLAA